jgi:hypothetical protein
MASKKTETEAQKTKRIGPAREIVRWARKSKTSRTLFLECGHKRTVDMTERKHVRCRRCLTEGRLGPVRKGGAKVNGRKTEKKAA